MGNDTRGGGGGGGGGDDEDGRASTNGIVGHRLFYVRRAAGANADDDEARLHARFRKTSCSGSHRAHVGITTSIDQQPPTTYATGCLISSTAKLGSRPTSIKSCGASPRKATTLLTATWTAVARNEAQERVGMLRQPRGSLNPLSSIFETPSSSTSYDLDKGEKYVVFAIQST